MLAKSISGAAAAVQPAFIEDVFSTYLYTGNGSTQTITNGIDLAGKGGLVWVKGRSYAGTHELTDTARGATKTLQTNSTAAQGTKVAGLTAFTSSGFSVGNNYDYNLNANTLASWAFRKQAKFFDVVTYTGNGVAGRTVPHNLGSVPGCIIVKKTSGAEDWFVYHRSIGSNKYLALNLTQASVIDADVWNNTTPTDSVFSLGPVAGINQSGATYVAYLFAHDAGGFGLTGTDNVISCGSYTGNGSATGPVVTLGYEPQWLLVKRTSSSAPWYLVDNMRGLALTGNGNTLWPNFNLAENAYVAFRWAEAQATGFQIVSNDTEVNASGNTYIYIAIRRGPMRTPTSGTQVFSPTTFSTASGSNQTISSPQAIDMGLLVHAPVNGVHYVATRLIGSSATLQTQSTDAESTTTTAVPTPASQNAFTSSMFFRIEGGNQTYWNSTGSGTNCFYGFRRAPGFFDVVCDTGTGSAHTISHNLTVVPELMIRKCRGSATNNRWVIYAAPEGATKGAYFDTGAFQATSSFWNNTSPTSSVFTVGSGNVVNQSTLNFVTYLFATVTGVSKVGSYTGTGTTKQIDCGFTGGARFVLIKRTDSTGDWYVWDSARGIVAGNDPYLLLNSTAAEVTNTDYIDTYSAGFEISSTAPAAINANGGTFIFLAIA